MSLQPCWFHGVGGRTGRLDGLAGRAISCHHIPVFPSPLPVPPPPPIPPPLPSHITNVNSESQYFWYRHWSNMCQTCIEERAKLSLKLENGPNGTTSPPSMCNGSLGPLGASRINVVWHSDNHKSNQCQSSTKRRRGISWDQPPLPKTLSGSDAWELCPV